MIKKLQRKFIMITMGSLFVVMLILIGSINAIILYKTNQKLDGAINAIADYQGRLPEFVKGDIQERDHGFRIYPETKFETRYFIVEINTDGSTKEIDTSHIKGITSVNAVKYADKVISSGKSGGYRGVYKYKVIKESYGYMVVFLYCRNDLQMSMQLLAISCIVSLLTLLVMFVLVSVLSKKAIQPIIESSEKQKLFITDAGHEIKTPLSIISANADVLELMGGESEWITSIRNQVIRLDKLVKNLLMLSKMEEDNIKVCFADFDLSEAVDKIAGPFETIAATKNKKFYMNIQPGIRMLGDQGSMEQLVSTLVDNALKYSNEEGMIKITLSSAKKGIKLEVFNTTDQVETDNLDKLFDRFYRSDASRSRETGGYGIGLSIAKSIVEAHHGRISVKSEDGKSICFTVVI